MNTVLSPYIMFPGTTREAMEFYKSVFGGEVKIMTYKESGYQDAVMADRIIHAGLEVDGLTILASDTSPQDEKPIGDTVHMCLIGSDEAKLRDSFDKLSVGGKVDMPLQKQFWGDTYGQLTDKYGVHWMVNINAEKVA